MFHIISIASHELKGEMVLTKIGKNIDLANLVIGIHLILFTSEDTKAGISHDSQNTAKFQGGAPSVAEPRTGCIDDPITQRSWADRA